MNNYDFWEEYLNNVRKKIIELCNQKDTIQIDLHMHSNYSADGRQSISEILQHTKELNFDVISITDHDTLDAYEEIYNYVKNGLTEPIIIPGIEFTLDNIEYKNQFHILQLFINPKDSIIINDVQYAKKATFNRSKIQFNRIKYNNSLQKIFKDYHIFISYEEYIDFLNNNDLVPEYETLAEYLMLKLKNKNVTTFQVLKLLEKDNKLDIYPDRREYKEKRYKLLKKKYVNNNQNKYNVHLLLSMLAVREVDDDWWNFPNCGSLSVNSYGQMKIEELNKKYDTYFAHPDPNKLEVVSKILSYNSNIKGLELNKRNHYDNINDFYNMLKKYNKKIIIGSDTHTCTNEFYDNLEFYKISSLEMRKLI